MTTIVTLSMNAASQAAFDRLRQTHYPAHLNRIAAHLTLFHSLPDTDDIRSALQEEALTTHSFSMRVSHVMSLGRGVAYGVESAPLLAVHKRLSLAFAADLIPQDKQRFRPHVVVQNKVSGAEAKALREALESNFRPWDVQADGLSWWNYLGGPWELRETFPFASSTARE